MYTMKNGKNLSRKHVGNSSKCQELCKSNWRCHYWTYQKDSSICLTMSRKGEAIENSSYISGSQNCPHVSLYFEIVVNNTTSRSLAESEYIIINHFKFTYLLVENYDNSENNNLSLLQNEYIFRNHDAYKRLKWQVVTQTARKINLHYYY